MEKQLLFGFLLPFFYSVVVGLTKPYCALTKQEHSHSKIKAHCPESTKKREPLSILYRYHLAGPGTPRPPFYPFPSPPPIRYFNHTKYSTPPTRLIPFRRGGRGGGGGGDSSPPQLSTKIKKMRTIITGHHPIRTPHKAECTAPPTQKEANRIQ